MPEHRVQLQEMRIVPLTAVAVVFALAPGAGSAAPTGTTLVELLPAARCIESAFVVGSGGTVVAPSLGLYRVPETATARIVARLQAHHALRFTTPNRIVGTLAVRDFADPLVPTEWWRAAVGVDLLTPPGPGKPVTIVDAGMDTSHPEFLNRPNTVTMNPQEPAPIGGNHGTMVASLVAAPVNGVGLAGIYPDALLRSWDAAKGQGTALQTNEIVQGLLAAAANGPGVVNLSLGANRNDPAIEQAVYTAISKGTLVVAASGNEGDTGNPLDYPASIPHVLTAAATNASNAVAPFSSRSRFVDLAAPGVNMTVARAINEQTGAVDETWAFGESGTSFASPLVSGAAAWVWTVRPDLDATQLFEVMRRSATDIGVPGRDDASGFGLLNVPAALSLAAPIRDPFEPNDDMDFVRPGGRFDNSIPPLTTKARRKTTLAARLDRVEDPRDVYRIWLPRNARVTVTSGADANIGLSLWQRSTVSVTEHPAGTDRLARGTAPGTTASLTFSNKGPGRFGFLAVIPAKGVQEATYRLLIS